MTLLLNEDADARMMEWVYNPGNVIITGPIGCGKTTLAKYMMDQISCRYILHGSDSKKSGKSVVDSLLKDTFDNTSIMSFFDKTTKGIIFDEIETYNLSIDDIYSKYKNEKIIYVLNKIPELSKTTQNISIINIDLDKTKVLEHFSEIYQISKSKISPYFDYDLRKLNNNIEFIKNNIADIYIPDKEPEFICSPGNINIKFDLANLFPLHINRILFQNYKKCVAPENHHIVSGFICESDVIESAMSKNNSWGNFNLVSIVGGVLPSMYVEKDPKNMELPQVLSKVSNANGRRKILHDLQKEIVKKDRHYDTVHKVRALRSEVIHYIKIKQVEKAQNILNRYNISIQNLLRIYDSDITKKDKVLLKKLFKVKS
tara:strand:+ start:1907 stop:3022 length:1116 start_codon:yes stop_codon:yes gene_type:complete